MTLNINETPAKMTSRRRVVRFSEAELKDILARHCRKNGVEISDDCALHVWGIYSQHGREGVAFCIDGD